MGCEPNCHCKFYEIPLKLSTNEPTDDFDALVIVALSLDEDAFKDCCSKYLPLLRFQRQFDNCFDCEGGLVIASDDLPVRKAIYSPVGPVNRDYDDVRRFSEAAFKGVKRAMNSGAKKPMIVLPICSQKLKNYPLFDIATVLGAYAAGYVPLEIREALGTRKIDLIGFCNFQSLQRSNSVFRFANAIEIGRAVARDIGGSDPERMSPPKAADYVKKLFEETPIKVEIISDSKKIEKEFPCLAAVNRASVERHQARVIFLRYDPTEEAEKTLILVGKGVCYDTGGSDIKAGGVMAGMHRDKCGAAAVAGFFQTVAHLKPAKTRVVGVMAMVRNSIGPDGYVADELITARSGVRVRVGNTDAEGRMAMVDFLAYFREKIFAEKFVKPELFTIATLTGHACLAVGDNYSIIMDNGPARVLKTAESIKKAGDEIGDLFEISTIRREDYEFNKGKSEYEDILQCNNAPSSRTPRGHQLPAAFLLQVSGLDKHGLDSQSPLPFSHIDIAGSSGPFPGIPTGAPIAALTNKYFAEQF